MCKTSILKNNHKALVKEIKEDLTKWKKKYIQWLGEYLKDAYPP